VEAAMVLSGYFALILLAILVAQCLLKVWDTKSTTCFHTVTLHEGQTVQGVAGGATISKVIPLPRTVDQFLVCNQSNIIYLVNLNAKVPDSLLFSPFYTHRAFLCFRS
jgi:hypothetical protein